MPAERLAAARGAVRDGVAGIESFAQLLGSRRIGPRGVALALPEARDGCAALAVALERLAEAIREGFAECGDAEAAEAACAAVVHANAEVARLRSELSSPAAPAASGRSAARGSSERGVDVRRRLSLEASVRRATRELDGALHLADLVSATLALRPTPIDLIDVLRECSSSAEGPRVAEITVAAEAPCEIEGDVRVLGGLIELSVGMVSAAGVTSPHLVGTRLPGGPFKLRVGQRGARDGPFALAFKLALRDGGELAATVARVVARRARIELLVEGGGRVALLTI